jgi:hypothetical protein
MENVGCPDCGSVGRIDSRDCSACMGRGTQPVEMHRVCQQCDGSGKRFPDEASA